MNKKKQLNISKFRLKQKKHLAKHKMKSSKDMPFINTNYSNSIHRLSMNKEQKPKQKPISKTQPYAKNQREKHKIK